MPIAYRLTPSLMNQKWWIVIAASVAHAVNTGLSYFGLSAFFPSLEREFGWSRTAISGAFSLARIESGLLGPLEGYLTDRLGPPRMMFIGIFLSATGFLALSWVYSLPTLYAVMILGIVLGSSLGYNLPISVVIANLFRARRSLAFGIFRMGPGLSGPLVPVVGWMIAMWGWRSAAVASGFILLVIGLPLAFLLARTYGRREMTLRETPVAAKSTGSASRDRSDPQFTLREAVGTTSFWTLSIAMALRQMVTEGVSVHFVILLVDRGWSTEAASGLLGISALISAPARLGVGWLGDLLDKRRLMMGLLIALGVSVLFMGGGFHPSLFTPFMVIYSLAYGGLASLQEPIRADYFGTRYFASIQGMSRSVTVVGTFLGPTVAGFFYDLTRSYAVPFALFAFVSLVSTLCMFLTKPPVKRTA